MLSTILIIVLILLLIGALPTWPYSSGWGYGPGGGLGLISGRHHRAGTDGPYLTQPYSALIPASLITLIPLGDLGTHLSREFSRRVGDRIKARGPANRSFTVGASWTIFTISRCRRSMTRLRRAGRNQHALQGVGLLILQAGFRHGRHVRQRWRTHACW